MTEQQLQSVMSQNIAQAAASQSLTLQKAEQLAELVLKRAAEMGVNAVVAVADSGGNPVLCKRADHAFLASWDIALGKAYTVTALKMSTAKLSVLAAPGGELYGIQFTNGGKIVIFSGGEPLQSSNGTLVGGLGVSGGTEGQDTSLSEYGAEVFKQL